MCRKRSEKGGRPLGIAYDPAAVSLTAARAGGDLPPDVQLQVQKRPANQCPPPVTNVVTDAETKSISIPTTDGQICCSGEPSLLRGDVNGDGRFDISDPIGILSCLFLGESCGLCPDSADVDDNGEREITDAILLLGWRFLDAGSEKRRGAARRRALAVWNGPAA